MGNLSLFWVEKGHKFWKKYRVQGDHRSQSCTALRLKGRQLNLPEPRSSTNKEQARQNLEKEANFNRLDGTHVSRGRAAALPWVRAAWSRPAFPLLRRRTSGAGGGCNTGLLVATLTTRLHAFTQHSTKLFANRFLSVTQRRYTARLISPYARQGAQLRSCRTM